MSPSNPIADPLKKKPAISLPGSEPVIPTATPSLPLLLQSPAPSTAQAKVGANSMGVQAGMANLRTNLGIPAPVPTSPRAFHSPVQPGLQQPAQSPPGTLARGTFDAAAAGIDALQSPIRGVADLANRGAIGVRNFVSQGFGGGVVEPAAMNYHATADQLAAARAGNAAPAAPTAAAAPPAPVAAPRTTPRPVIIDPANAASMQLTPPNRGLTSPAGSSAPTPTDGGVAGGRLGRASRPVAYNAGSGATYTTGDGRLGNLPAGIAAVKQKNGVNAFGGTGASVASATRSPLGAAPAQFAPPVAVTQPNLAVPSLDLPSINTFRTSDAERERAGLAKNIDDQLRDMNFAGLNSRGKRELYANLLRERSGLAENGGNLAGSAAAAQLGAATSAGASTQSQVGENARALLGSLSEAGLEGMRQQGENVRTAAALDRPTQVTDADGNLLRVAGSTAAPVTMSNGASVRLPMPADASTASPDAVLAAYTQQLKTIADSASIGGKPPDYSALDASPLGQRVQRLIEGSSASRTPTEKDIARLKAEPHLAAYFDAHFGSGASSRYLGGRQ